MWTCIVWLPIDNYLSTESGSVLHVLGIFVNINSYEDNLKDDGIGTDTLLIIADTTGHLLVWFPSQSRRGPGWSPASDSEESFSDHNSLELKDKFKLVWNVN